MSRVLARWNLLPVNDATGEILPCCGSQAWARAMAARQPVAHEASLLAVSDEIWLNLAEPDWLEAFRSHPRIGDSKAPKSAQSQSVAWSAQEQALAARGEDAVKVALAEGNREYERRFGRTFIVCATGQSAQQILDTLRRRLRNDAQTELREAVEQQRQITQIRLKKWLQE
jgi:2-oxo-4-hydroxy-4-carboxy-5-ureidoimidazoline decarboxylase